MNSGKDTKDAVYTRYLIAKGDVWWKRIIDVQAPYRWNLRRLKPGYTLEIGCGTGRNLEHLHGNAVGIDHNLDSVVFARNRGFTALLPEEFSISAYNQPERFDSLLMAHVAEHMTLPEAMALISTYMPNIKRNGQLILITPQEAGFKSDPTHVEFMDFNKLQRIHHELGLAPKQEYSFPFPRYVGRVFTYNEFIVVGMKVGEL